MSPVDRFIAALPRTTIDMVHHYTSCTDTGRRGKARFEFDDHYHLIINDTLLGERLSLVYSVPRARGAEAFGEMTVLADFDPVANAWTRVVSRERWSLTPEDTRNLAVVVARHFAAHLPTKKAA